MTILVRSRSRRGVVYEMTRTPEGIAIHQGEGCEGEPFNGPTACWHSKGVSMTATREVAIRTQAVLTPAPVAFNDEQLSIIKSTIAKGATDAELALFVATCTRTGLDPFMRQIYAVKRYDSREKREVMAIQVGIDGLRLVAERTDKYAGQDPIEWLDVNGVWSEVWTGAGDYPVAARCSVYRKDWPNHKATAVCRWGSYAQTFGQDNRLSPTWARMPDVMLGKCAEALALRRAFPAEMSGLAASVGSGGDYDAELDVEMQQTRIEPTGPVIDGEARVVEQAPEAQQEEQRTRNAPAAGSTPARGSSTNTRPPAAPAQPTMLSKLAEAGYNRERVDDEAQRRYDNNDWARLSNEQKRELTSTLLAEAEASKPAGAFGPSPIMPSQQQAAGIQQHEPELSYTADMDAVCLTCGYFLVETEPDVWTHTDRKAPEEGDD